MGDTRRLLECSLSGDSEYGLASSAVPLGGERGSAAKRIRLRLGVDSGDAGPLLPGDRGLSSGPKSSVRSTASYVLRVYEFSSRSLEGGDAAAAASRCSALAARLNSTDKSPALRLGTKRSEYTGPGLLGRGEPSAPASERRAPDSGEVTPRRLVGGLEKGLRCGLRPSICWHCQTRTTSAQPSFFRKTRGQKPKSTTTRGCTHLYWTMCLQTQRTNLPLLGFGGIFTSRFAPSRFALRSFNMCSLVAGYSGRNLSPSCS
jgi:hypothetical protein